MILLIVLVLPAGTAAEENSLKIYLLKRPFNLNPIYGSNQTELKIINQLFDSLVSYNSENKLTANLAESWEINERGNRFIFKLKKDVFFNSCSLQNQKLSRKQRRVKAADWKWSLEYLADPENKSPYAYLLKKVKGYDEYRQKKAAEISGIKVISDYKLEINLKESFAPFIYNLSHQAASVMPRQAVLEKENFFLKPVGTGPFKVTQFAENKIVLTKNNNYWLNNYSKLEAPAVDKLEINFADKDLNYQDFDLYQLSQKEYLKYKKRKEAASYQLKKAATDNLFFLAFNYQSKFGNSVLSEREAEKLLAYLKTLIDEDEFINRLEVESFVKADNLFADDEADILSSIYEKKALPEEDFDFKNSAVDKINLISNNSKIQQQSTALIKKMLADQLELELNSYNWVDYFKKIVDDNSANLFLMSYDFENKFDFFYDNFHSESALNYYNYSNRRIDNLLDYLILFNNPSDNERAYQLIEKILKDDNPYLFVLRAADNYLISSKSKNREKINNFLQDFFLLP